MIKMKKVDFGRIIEVIKDLIKQYWEGEGSNTYAFCIDLYICMFTMASVSKLFKGNLSYGSQEHALFVAILAGFAIVEFIVLFLFYSLCKKKGYKSIYLKIMNYLAIVTTVLTIILNIIKF